jgi:osmoprotectant transport system permease protein
VNERLAAAFALLPNYLGQHVMLSAAALALGLLISLPLALAAVRRPRLRWPLLAFAGLVQTIPSLALLALFYPLLLAISALSRQIFGAGFSALGFLPSLLALTLYSMLPIIRNTIAGMLGLDPAVIEAARAVGMTDRQRLLRVELPLAAPVLMAGIRTAAVWVIGAATLATPVGQTSLGNYIFTGLQIENWESVLFGCAVAAALALLTDQILGQIETGVAERKAWRIAGGAAALAAGLVAALLPLAHGQRATYLVGAKNFSEQYILADLMAERIAGQGAAVEQRGDLGSVVAFRALAKNDIDAYVDYSGTLWTNIMGRTDNPPRDRLLRELSDWLRREQGVTMLGALGFENAYALAMRRDRAEKLGLKSIADLARQAPNLKIGGDLEFFSRPEWKAISEGYGLRFGEQKQYQPTFMYRAVGSGEVDVISAFSSDGRILADDLVVLADPKGLVLPYDAVLLLSPRRAEDATLKRALQPLVGAIPIEVMREANLMVDRSDDKQTPQETARWMAAKVGLDKR